MKKILKLGFAALVIVFLLLQFTNPPRTNPPVKNNFPMTNAPPHIAAMLRGSCYDCHSAETHWPWYSHIAPLSWQIARDVNDGRGQVNFSDWPTNSVGAVKRLEDMSEQIDDDKMPLKKYTLIHRDARLTDAGRKELTDWLDAEAARLKSSTAMTK